MDNLLWFFVAGTIFMVSGFFFASATSVVDVIMGGIPLLFLVVFGVTYWIGRRRRRREGNPLSEDLPDTDE
jgi:hypothetical protein